MNDGAVCRTLLIWSIVVVFVIIGVQTSLAKSGQGSGQSNSCTGAIFATHWDNSTDDWFDPGEDVYLTGFNLKENTWFNYTVENKDSNAEVASGKVKTNDTGYIEKTYIYTIPTTGYASKYRVILDLSNICCNHKVDSFYVRQSIPEFPAVVIPAISVIGLMFLVRRRIS